MFKVILIILSVTCCECLYVYSSFWAPRMLNYKVDVSFDPDAGRKVAEDYQNMNGYRGEKIIADLGNGEWPKDYVYDPKVYGQVTIYYNNEENMK